MGWVGNSVETGPSTVESLQAVHLVEAATSTLSWNLALAGGQNRFTENGDRINQRFALAVAGRQNRIGVTRDRIKFR